MKRSLFTAALLLSGFLLVQSPAKSDSGRYDYPFADRWVATVLGTPAQQRVHLVRDIPVKLISLEIFPDRKFPDAFWYNDRLLSSLAYQKHKAPLIFVIAGTGAGFNSDKMLSLQSIFYEAGFHVISISSPTHPNFVAAASESMAPGVLEDDGRDLYRVMQRIWEQARSEVEVTDVYLTGYSLGGTQAAFVSKLDDEQKRFNFRKVLMINPAVSLFSSVTLLDSMLEDNIPGGAGGAGRFLREVLDRFSQIYSEGDFVKFDHEFLFNIYRNLPAPPKQEDLKALIGISFRIASSNMIFVADVMRHAGFVVPKDLSLDRNDPLDDYVRTLAYISFARYLDDFLLPVSQARNAQTTRQGLIDQSSLRSIEAYLQAAGKVGVLTNADDIILAPGELEYLTGVFGARATIFPRGGHCGNIDHRDVAAAMTRYFAQP